MNETNSIISTNAVSNVADSFKDLGLEWLLDYFTILEPIDYITVIINLLILIFGKQIITHLSVQTVGAAPPQLRLLRILNAVLFLTYLFAVAFQFQLASNISHTGLLVLLTYLIWQLTHSIILKKYGRKREVEGTSIYVESYTSSNLKLIALLILGVISGLVFLNLWKLEWLLQTTSFLGALAVLIFTTKDYWLKDFISGIIVISNGNIERGDVIRIPDENILAIVLETRTMLTLLRDVIRNHNITVPNSLLLNKQVEILTTESRKGIYDYVEFNIGYETDSEKARGLPARCLEKSLQNHRNHQPRARGQHHARRERRPRRDVARALQPEIRARDCHRPQCREVGGVRVAGRVRRKAPHPADPRLPRRPGGCQ